MALSTRVDGLDSDGITLLSPLSPEFDQVARPLLGERIADIGLRLKPVLVIVSNLSPQTIVSLSVTWNITYKDGRRHLAWGHTSFPEVVCGDALISHNPEALPPGRKRIEANGLVIHGYGDGDVYYDQFLAQFVDQKEALLAGAADLHIELNGVIFADGTLVGADDQSRLTDLFSAYVLAKQRWYRGIIEALEAGRSVADAFSAAEQFLADLSQRMRQGSFRLRDNSADLWTQQGAGEAVRWRHRFTDEEIPGLLKQSIRLEPFVIRRRSLDPP